MRGSERLGLAPGLRALQVRPSSEGSRRSIISFAGQVACVHVGAQWRHSRGSDGDAPALTADVQHVEHPRHPREEQGMVTGGSLQFRVRDVPEVKVHLIWAHAEPRSTMGEQTHEYRRRGSTEP